MCRDSYPDGPDAFDDDWGEVAAECYAYALDVFDPAAVEQDILLDRITYDPVNAASCLMTAWGATSCATYFDTGPAYAPICFEVMAGVVPDGGSCESDYSCANASSYCDDSTCTP